MSGSPAGLMSPEGRRRLARELIFCLFLCLSLCLTLFPASSLAAAELRVLDPADAPAGGARVLLLEPRDGEDDPLALMRPPLASGETDEHGRLELDLPALDGLLLVVDFPDALPAAVAEPATHLSADSQGRLTLRLEPGEAWAGSLAHLAASGIALAGARLCAAWTDDYPRWSYREVRRRCGQVGEDGGFRLAGLPRGALEATLEVPGFLPIHETVTAPVRGQPETDWRPRRGIRVTGRLTAVSRFGPPVVGARVESAAAAVESGEDGRFVVSLAGLPDEVSIRAAGFRARAVAVARPEGRRADTVPPSVDPSLVEPSPVDLGTVVLKPGESIVGAVGVIEGAEEKTPPPESVEVWLQTFRDDGSRRGEQRRIELDESRFRIDLQGPGRYAVRVAVPGFRGLSLSESPAADSGSGSGGPEPWLRVDEGETVDLGELLLDRGAVVRGRWLDPETLKPVAGVEAEVALRGLPAVSATAIRDRHRAVSDADGRFEITGLGPGPYFLKARHRRFAPHLRELDLEAGAVAPLGDTVLEAGGRLRGRLTDRDGEGIVGARLLLRDPLREELRPQARCLTGEDGAFDCPPIPAGVYGLEVEKEGRLLTTSVEIPPGVSLVELELESLALTLEVEARLGGVPVPKGRLSIHPLFAPGRHEGRVLLSFRGPARADFRSGPDGASAFAEAGPEGRFTIPRVLPGPALLRLEGYGGPALTLRKMVPDRHPAALTADFSAVELRGRLIAADGGEGVVGRVRLSDELGSALAETSTDPDGAFTFSGLEPGPYRLEASAAGHRSDIREVRLEAGAADLRWELEAGEDARLTVRLRRPTGEPAADSLVTLVSASGALVRSLPLEAGGERAFDGLAPGTYFVVWKDPGGGVGASEALSLDDGASLIWEGALSAGSRVEASFPGGGGPGATVGFVTLKSEEGVDLAPYLEALGNGLRVSAAGRLLLGRLAPGRYELRVWSGDEIWERSFEVSPGVPTIVSVR